jgi:hypothetical protein
MEKMDSRNVDGYWGQDDKENRERRRKSNRRIEIIEARAGRLRAGSERFPFVTTWKADRLQI